MSLLRFFQGLMIVSLLHGGSTWAATYWVSKSGSDGNPCFASNTQPNLTSQSRRTIMAGTACLRSGDTLMVMPGNYNEQLVNPLPNGATMRGADSNPANWPSLKPQNNVVPNGGRVINHTQDRTTMISYRFFRVDLSAITSGNKPANCWGGANHAAIVIRIEDFECIGAAPGMMYIHGSGISMSSHADSRGIVRRGIIRDLIAEENNPGAHGFYWRGSHGLVENVHIENVNGRCINYRYAAGHNTFRYNFCRNAKGASSVTSPQGDTTNNVFHNNIFWQTEVVALRNTTQQKFFNNVVYGASNGCLLLQGSNHTVQNNILLNCGGSAISNQSTGSEISHNLTSGKASDIFVDHARGNFALKAGSAAIDAGTTLTGITQDFVGTPRPQGCCYDIGAFEYVSSGSKPPAPGNLQIIAK